MEARQTQSSSKASWEGLCRLAVSRGAADARIISAAEIPVDPRVRLKCMIPKCYISGACGHCPPHGDSIEEVREMIAGYEKAVFFHVRVPADIIAAKDLTHHINQGKVDDAGNLLNLGGHYMLVYTITAVLRKKAMEMGFSQTDGFAAGNCRDVLCFLKPFCRRLSRTGNCRHPDISVPSLESSGLDAFGMAASVGWTVYPIGGACEPHSVAHGMLMGLVLAR